MSPGGAVVASLRQVADDELYRRNAFRMTGLPVDAASRAVRERQKRAAAAAAVGVPVASDERLPLPTPPSEDGLRAAYEVLADPRRRLVHELFWFWGEDVSACGCDPRTHRAHDGAVDAHARALDAEATGDRVQWAPAHERWADALRGPGMWAHLRARVEALDDTRRLDLRAVDELAAELPRALVATVVSCATHSDSPQRLRVLAEHWPVGAADLEDLLLDAVADRVRTVEARLTEARERLLTDPVGAARLLLPAVVTDLAWIDALAPHDRFRGPAELREQAAIVLNNAALGVVERGNVADRDEAVMVYGAALTLTTTAATRETIVRNRDGAKDALDPATAALYEDLTAALQGGEYRRASAIASELLAVVRDPSERASLRSIARTAADLAGTTPRAARRSVGSPSGLDRVRSAVAVVLVLALIVAGIFGVVSVAISDPRWLIFVGSGLSIVAIVVLLRRAANRDLDEP